ncbi:MAG: Fe-S cluster assembly protein HesB [Candidatus Eremiobacteraeota bacterium]|nr:Fe-S cluster assembly protein HesB [Candidatus Eremiobacteraeota bacterium]
MKPQVVHRIKLAGTRGEPIHFYRTIRSHGLAGLPPASIDSSKQTLRTVLRLDGVPVPIELRGAGNAMEVIAGVTLDAARRAALFDSVSRMFRLDDDLTPFYAMIADDTTLQWASNGAGRLLASPTVFEDVIKTVCTTNCAWSATVRMTTALVELGGGAFPDARLLADTPDAWYRDRARMGYRGAYVREIARAVASGACDLESLLPRFGMSDAQVEGALLELPGIGPYGAAHIMQLLGRHRNLILDSWTRPTFLRLAKKKRAKDATIVRTFARYGPYAGLAFWLYLTRDWT